ncbi:MAG: choice-of-anchor Q domain-containing protein [Thermomicrobiales bacterium]
MTGRNGAMLPQYARVLAGVFLLACLIVLPPVHAGATTLTVSNCNNSGTGSLRDAIATANGTVFDVITFGVDCPSGAGTQITLTSGTLTLSRAMKIDGSGHTVVIDGGGAMTVFTMPIFSTVTLNHLTIQHGSASVSGGTCSAGTCGGGIANTGGATLSVTNSTLSGNSASTGGGIYNVSGILTVTNSTVSGNSATGTGGGGGIFHFGGTLTVAASTFSGNSASIGGSILSNSGNVNVNATAAVTNSTFSGNSAGRGGGIAADNYNTVTVTNSTLAGNSAHFGGGIFIFSGGTVSLTNTLLAANTVTLGGANCENTVGGTLTDGGHNLEFNPTNTCGFSAANHDVLADPHLGALGSNGGPTQTMALLTGSSAIAHGDATVCANTSGTAPVAGKDQRGYLR